MPSKLKFAIATNASVADEPRLVKTIPHWLRVFGDQLEEIHIAIDDKPLAGRIAQIHNNAAVAPERIVELCQNLANADSRVRFSRVDYSLVESISMKWFNQVAPIRCKVSSPIFAFLYTMEKTRGRVVMHNDCDMVFQNDGWLDQALELLETDQADLVSPPRCGFKPGQFFDVSSRSFMYMPEPFAKRCLPLRRPHLPIHRYIQCVLKGQNKWYSLEQMLERNVDWGRIRHKLLYSKNACSMHIISHAQAAHPKTQSIIEAFEQGQVPEAQVESGWNFDPVAWGVSQ